MEASEILKIVDDALYNRFFVIDVILSDDDSTIRVLLKHTFKGAQGQVLESSKGKLDEGIPESSFLSDPSHCVKVVYKHILPSSTKLGLRYVGAPKQILSDSRKIGGAW